MNFCFIVRIWMYSSSQNCLYICIRSDTSFLQKKFIINMFPFCNLELCLLNWKWGFKFCSWHFCIAHWKCIISEMMKQTIFIIINTFFDQSTIVFTFCCGRIDDSWRLYEEALLQLLGRIRFGLLSTKNYVRTFFFLLSLNHTA